MAPSTSFSVLPNAGTVCLRRMMCHAKGLSERLGSDPKGRPNDVQSSGATPKVWAVRRIDAAKHFDVWGHVVGKLSNERAGDAHGALWINDVGGEVSGFPTGHQGK